MQEYGRTVSIFNGFQFWWSAWHFYIGLSTYFLIYVTRYHVLSSYCDRCVFCSITISVPLLSATSEILSFLFLFLFMYLPSFSCTINHYYGASFYAFTYSSPSASQLWSTILLHITYLSYNQNYLCPDTFFILKAKQ